MAIDSLLPPRKRDWKPGTYQVGVFIRTDDGSVLEMVTMNPASKRQIELAFELARTPCQPDMDAAAATERDDGEAVR